MILRELLAVFGLGYDERGQRKAEAGLQALQNQANDLASVFSQVFSATAIAAPFLALAELASDADENLNLLELAFGENAAAVVKWSNETGPAIGRSRFTLRELAAEFGGLLQPMVGTGDALSDMSTTLATLAVDLSSARNIGENDALQALQSGLAGNIIAMKRFGVNLSAVRVQQEALSMGLSKNTKDLTQAQLATIRYNLITKDLAFIAGDAANTMDGYANSTRALRDSLKDIGTELGLFLVPALEAGLKSTREMLAPVVEIARAFKEWAADTNLAQAAISSLNIMIGAVLLPLLLKILPLLLGFAVFVFIMDDVITAFQGGNSVLLAFAKILDTLEKEGFPGMGVAAKIAIGVFNRLRDAIGATMAVIVSLFTSLMEGDLTPFFRTIEAIQLSFDEWADSLGPWGRAMRAFLNLIVNQFVAVGGLVAGIVEAIATGSFSPLRGALEGVKGLFRDTQADFQGILGPQAAGFTAGGGSLAGAPGAVSDSPLASRQVTVQQGAQTVTINVEQQLGEDAEEFAQRVADIFGDMDKERDEALFTELVPTAAGAQ